MTDPGPSPSPLDFEGLSLTEIIRLQYQLSQVLKRRFEKRRAIAFTDIVGSTPYFQRFGNEAGKALHQLHVDLLSQSIEASGGKIVGTSGDGALTSFPTADAGISALTDLLARIAAENMTRNRLHQLSLRVGLHWGRILTDGATVAGDAVNVAARIGDSGAPGELRLSQETFGELSSAYRIQCQPLPATTLKGVAEPMNLFSLDGRLENMLPDSVLIRELGEEIELPKQDLISFGRLRQADGLPANDVVLSLRDKQLEKTLSRWHFELRRKPEGYVLRPLSVQSTEVDGQLVGSGEEVLIAPGTVVRLSKVMTLEFRASRWSFDCDGGATISP